MPLLHHQPPKLKMGISLVDSSRHATITIDGQHVGSIEFVNSHTARMFLDIIALASDGSHRIACENPS